MSIADKIKCALERHGKMSESELARRIGISPQNFYSKKKRQTFTVEELDKIAAVLECKLQMEFKDEDFQKTEEAQKESGTPDSGCDCQ